MSFVASGRREVIPGSYSYSSSKIDSRTNTAPSQANYASRPTTMGDIHKAYGAMQLAAFDKSAKDNFKAVCENRGLVPKEKFDKILNDPEPKFSNIVKQLDGLKSYDRNNWAFPNKADMRLHAWEAKPPVSSGRQRDLAANMRPASSKKIYNMYTQGKEESTRWTDKRIYNEIKGKGLPFHAARETNGNVLTWMKPGRAPNAGYRYDAPLPKEEKVLNHLNPSRYSSDLKASASVNRKDFKGQGNIIAWV